jgi:hypothetical protein
MIRPAIRLIVVAALLSVCAAVQLIAHARMNHIVPPWSK